MRIAVIDTNEKEEKLIVQEALNRGLDVTVVVRRDNKSAVKQVAKKII